jgi:hypothetical protein
MARAISFLERRFGVLPHGDFRAALAGASGPFDLPSPAPSVTNQRAAVRYVDDQIGEKCVEDSYDYLRHLAVGFSGARGSSTALYAAARARTRARQTDPIADFGSTVPDMQDAACATGIPPRSPRDDDPNAVNQLETWEELAGSATASREDFVPVDDGDLDTLDRWLTRLAGPGSPGGGFQFVMPVTRQYQRLAGRTIWTGPGDNDATVGLHAQAVIGYTGLSDDDAYEVWGTWGRFFADAGFAYVSRRYMRSLFNACLTVVKGGPVL